MSDTEDKVPTPTRDLSPKSDDDDSARPSTTTNNHGNEADQRMQGLVSPKSDSVAPERPAKRSLTELEEDGDEDERKEKRKADREDDDDDDDEEEDKEEGEGDADDDEEDEEDEDSEEERDRPRKKKRRRRAGGNQFLDIEADVDEDEDEEEDEGEEGFVANDDFIVNQRREPRAGGLLAEGDEDLGDLGENEGDLDGDAMHRQLDRRRMAKRDREAAELAAAYRDRYGKSSYINEGDGEWAPKALLMPGVNDPSIWGLRCKVGRERDLIMSISRKAAALAASEDGEPLEIISAFQRDSLKGFLYVEARSETAVRKAVHNLIGMYHNGKNGIFLVDIEEMPDLLKTRQKKVEIVPGSWVRIKRGKHAGDLAQVIDMGETDEEVLIKFIPRIDLTPKEDAFGPDGKKRKKTAGNVAFRPPQNFFNPDEISRVYGNKELVQRPGKSFAFRNDLYKDGYCEKEMRITGLTLEDVHPTIDEVTRFNDRRGADGEPIVLDLSGLSDASSKSILQPGDQVDIFEGDQKGIYGTIESILGEVVTVVPHTDLDLDGTKVEVPAKNVRKRFKAGDHIKVMAGTNQDETGLVVKVQDDIVTFMSDLSMQEVDVFAKDVREAAEVGSGNNTVGQYQLHDLVQLDKQNTGVIFKIERDMLRVLDQSRTVRLLKPSAILGKVSSQNAVATDSEGYEIRAGDEMKEAANIQDGSRGRVLHVYRGIFAFLHNREYSENGGVFVTYARSLTSTAPKAKAQKVGQGLNPDLFAAPAIPQLQNVTTRIDGRINRRVAITKGEYKGKTGMIKDVIGDKARVELYTVPKTISIALTSLREQKPNGELVDLLERPSSGGGSYGARPGFAGAAGGGRGGYGAAGGRGGMQATATNSAPLGQPGTMGGRTPFPGYGGRTPSLQFAGGKTPIASGTGFANGRTPAPNYGGATPFAAGRTPAHPGFGGATPAHRSGAAGGSAWNPSSRTSFQQPLGAAADPFNPSAKTPRHPGARGDDAPSDSRTVDPRVDPRLAAGGRTPAYGSRTPAYTGRNSGDDYVGAPTPGAYAGAPTPAAYNAAPTPAAYGAAPTPAATTNYNDEWADGPETAPTPAAQKAHEYGGYQAKTPYEAPTPYAGAPTPYTGAPTPASAPTPAPYASQYQGAPTPATYGAAPTPGAYLNGPTPGQGYQAYQTPAPYQGAATAAAQPLDYQPRREAKQGLPSDWIVEGIRVLVAKSTFQENRLEGQHAVIKSTANGQSTVTIISNGETVEGMRNTYFTPMEPDRAGDRCMVLAGPYRGKVATTQSKDGSEWMVSVAGATPVIESNVLTLMG